MFTDKKDLESEIFSDSFNCRNTFRKSLLGAAMLVGLVSIPGGAYFLERPRDVYYCQELSQADKNYESSKAVASVTNLTCQEVLNNSFTEYLTRVWGVK